MPRSPGAKVEGFSMVGYLTTNPTNRQAAMASHVLRCALMRSLSFLAAIAYSSKDLLAAVNKACCFSDSCLNVAS